MLTEWEQMNVHTDMGWSEKRWAGDRQFQIGRAKEFAAIDEDVIGDDSIQEACAIGDRI